MAGFKIPIPFTGESVNLKNPTDAVKAFVLLVIGFAVLFLSQDLGQSVKQQASAALGLGSEGQQTRPNII